MSILRLRCGIANPEELKDEELIQAFRDYCLVMKHENEVLSATVYNSTMKSLSNFWRAINGKSIKD